MTEAQSSRNVPRSIGSVVAGIVVGVALSIVTDILLRAAGIFPALGVRMADSLLLLATAYRTVYSVLAAYVTARLAPSRPMFHAPHRCCHRNRGEHDRGNCDLERRPAIWTALVSDRADCARATDRMGRRPDSRSADRETEKQCRQCGIKRLGLRFCVVVVGWIP